MFMRKLGKEIEIWPKLGVKKRVRIVDKKRILKDRKELAKKKGKKLSFLMDSSASTKSRRIIDL